MHAAAGSTSAAPLGSGSSRPRPSSEEDIADLWADILKSADRGGRSRASLKRKNVLLLSERHRGRTFLLDQLARGGRDPGSAGAKAPAQPTLAVGYQVLQGTSEDGEEDSTPPLSVFYPPNSHPSLLKLVARAMPPQSLPDTAVVILLDWTQPALMIRELLGWMRWVDGWAASSSTGRGTKEEMRERLQSHVQHYTEPPPAGPSSSAVPGPNLAYYSGGPLLPLGPGSLTLNPAGVPIVVVCSRADLMDSTGDEMGMKGQWEERTDWVQQVLRTICLAYGAALFYTAPTQPQTYALLRDYLLHRLYTTPPPLHPADHAAPPPASPFPFAQRANVLDRDAVMVPAGWDSHGKINVLRDRFDPGRVLKAWERSCAAASTGQGEDGEEEGATARGETIEDLWTEMIPDTSRPMASHAAGAETTVEPEQTFLQRQLEHLQKDPHRDPRASFRQAAAAVSAASAASAANAVGTTGAEGAVSAAGSVGSVGSAGVVGPMGAGGLNLPGVEKVMAEMEGGSAEDMKEAFARIGRRETGRTAQAGAGGENGALRPASAVPNEALHNFFQGLLATKGKSAGGAGGAAGASGSARAPAPAAKE